MIITHLHCLNCEFKTKHKEIQNPIKKEIKLSVNNYGGSVNIPPHKSNSSAFLLWANVWPPACVSFRFTRTWRMTAWPKISSELSTRKKASWPSGAPAWSRVKGLNIPSLVSEMSHSCVLVCRVMSGSTREESKHWTYFRTGTLCLRQLHQLFSGERSGLQTRPSHRPQHGRSVQSSFRWHHTLVTINTFCTPIICICLSLFEIMNGSIFFRYTQVFSSAWYQHSSAFGILDFINRTVRDVSGNCCALTHGQQWRMGGALVVFWSVQVSQWRVWKQQDKWHQQENVGTSLSLYIKVTQGLSSITMINFSYVIIVEGCLCGCLAARGLAEEWWFGWDDWVG